MRFLRRAATEAKTGLSRTQLYDKVHQGKFPKPVKIGAKAVAWVEAEVDQWLADRIAARDAKNSGERA